MRMPPSPSETAPRFRPCSLSSTCYPAARRAWSALGGVSAQEGRAGRRADGAGATSRPLWERTSAPPPGSSLGRRRGGGAAGAAGATAAAAAGGGGGAAAAAAAVALSEGERPHSLPRKNGSTNAHRPLSPSMSPPIGTQAATADQALFPFSHFSPPPPQLTLGGPRGVGRVVVA